MLFEIPQDGDPDANKILQDKTLSTGLGFTLTKHHHVRKHGRIHEQEPGRWRFTNQASNSEWRVAADLDRFPSRSSLPLKSELLGWIGRRETEPALLIDLPKTIPGTDLGATGMATPQHNNYGSLYAKDEMEDSLHVDITLHKHTMENGH